MEAILSQISDFVWGPVLLILILGTGLHLMIGLGAMPVRKLGLAFRMLWAGRRAQGAGDVAPMAALMTSLSATLGIGNIAGVATAIGIGGPGAMFWMWCAAAVGMATKYAETLLAMHYRETSSLGHKTGGPMYYIKNGMGRRWLWLASLFALCGALAGFGIGNSVQASEVSRVMSETFSIPPWLSGVVMAGLAGFVLLGGIKRISSAAMQLVPLMGSLYLIGAVAVIGWHIGDVPAAFKSIVMNAFTPTAAAGGFAGAGILLAIQMGVARGIFSNEAGLGSAPIAHAAAQSDNAVEQGTLAMLGTFIDTLLCTLTALVIIVTGAWLGSADGAAMTASAFASVLPGGAMVVSVILALFAFTTIIGWSYYGERCVEYLLGPGSILPYRVLWTIVVYIGAVKGLDIAWLVSDILNALMAIPNLIALLVLSPVVFRLTREYFEEERAGAGRRLITPRR